MKLVTGPFQLELRPLRAVDRENWVRVQTIVAAEGFSGSFDAWLQLEDLRRFASEVEAMHSAIGTRRAAELSSAEPDIRLQLHSQPLGRILGTYQLESARHDGVPTALSGAFQLDQSFLPELVASVRSLVVALSETHVA